MRQRRAAASAAASGIGVLVACGSPSATAPGPVPAGSPVVSVVDGDTFDVDVGAATERVRIIGINAPEGGECFDDEATAALRGLVEGETVVLVADESERDRFGRLLRYVEVGGTDVGAELVRGGFAVVRLSEPDVARAAALRDAHDLAQGERRGLWAADACGPPVTGGAERLRIAEVHADAAGPDVENLNDEWVELENVGDEPVDLTGWIVRDESSSHRFELPVGFELAAGSRVRIHSGCGEATAAALFWCVSGSAVWNNDGDTAFLLDPRGNVVATLES